jgi:hypothetical protein
MRRVRTRSLGIAGVLAAAALIGPGQAIASSGPTTGDEALQIAKGLPAVKSELRDNPGSHWDSTKQDKRWREQLWTKDGQLVAEVFVAKKDGKVLEKWTGFQAAWTMARGYPGAFGKDASALWIWLPLLALFLLPFVPRGRPKLAHLDIAAIALLSVSIAGFNRGRIDISTPALYPPILWLLGRMIWRGLGRSKQEPGGLTTWIGPKVMLAGIVFLIGFRAAFAAADGNVIDVGEASVIGANKLFSGQAVYGHFPERINRGDTYGPVTWAAYVPFAAIFDANANDERLAAAGAGAIVIDLLAIGLMALVGWRLRGPPGALLLTWLWVTCPFTLYVAMCAANDCLPAALLALTLLSATVGGTRGAFVRGASAVVGGMSKMASLTLLPVFWRVKGSSRLRDVAVYAIACALAGAVVMVPYFSDPMAVYHRTVGFQAGRDSPFSAWGYWHLPEWSRLTWRVLTAALILLATFRPVARKRTVVNLAALSAAILIAVQLMAIYWFYTYLIWFLPAMFVALQADWSVKGTVDTKRTGPTFDAPPTQSVIPAGESAVRQVAEPA